MKVHHQGHHAAYVNTLNKTLGDLPSFQSVPLEELLQQVEKVPQLQRTLIRNHGGGHWNHSFWWPLLTPKPQEPSASLQKRIAADFGSWAAFRGQLLDAGARHFGSGWVWLVKTSSGKLQITTTANQDNPLMPYAEVRGVPVLGIDVWEHAYYLKYQNRRTEYLAAVWNILNWERVETLLG
jgi:Fe-Mn family superoxide dismutase